MTNFKDDPAFYREELEKLFPAEASRIVVADELWRRWPDGFFKDMAAQAPHVTLTDSYKDSIRRILKIMRRANIHHMSNGGFITVYDNRKNPEERVNMLFPLPPGRRPRAEYLSSSTRDFLDCRTVFNEKALDRPVLACLYFYRGAALAAAALQNVPRPPAEDGEAAGITYEDMTAIIKADVYAALKTYEQFGQRAIPVIETAADMKLSQLWHTGCKNMAGPAISRALNQYRTLKDAGAVPDEQHLRRLAAEAAATLAPSEEDFDNVQDLLQRWSSGQAQWSAISDGLLLPGPSPRSWWAHQFAVSAVFNDSLPELREAARRAFLDDYKGRGFKQAARETLAMLARFVPGL